MSEPSQPYDRVELIGPDGRARLLTRLEFESLPLSERVRSVLQKRLKFYSDGREITVGEALRNH